MCIMCHRANEPILRKQNTLLYEQKSDYVGIFFFSVKHTSSMYMDKFVLSFPSDLFCKVTSKFK